jgi:hypothetical protein
MIRVTYSGDLFIKAHITQYFARSKPKPDTSTNAGELGSGLVDIDMEVVALCEFVSKE